VISISLPLILIFSASCYWDYQTAIQTSNSAHDVALGDVLFDLEELIKKQEKLAPLKLTTESENMIRSNTPDMLYFSVWDSSGAILLGDKSLPSLDQLQNPNISFSDGLYQGAAVRIAKHRMNYHNTHLYVQVLETVKKREISSQKFLAAMLAPNLITMLVVLLAVLWGVRQGLKPLRNLEKEISQRSVNDLKEIELIQNPFELRTLLRHLNRLFELLRESNSRQQRFIADAAHQLRTPLAGLQTQIDLALGEGFFNQSLSRKENIQTATLRIEHLLNQLLSYARAENAMALKDSFKNVNLRSIAENSASIFIDKALEKNIDLGFDLSDVEVSGLAWMLQEALGNLIDNAIRYTPSKGVITVRCGHLEGTPFIEVEDNGPGIAAEELPFIFERFHHIPGSQGGGCGLGLSIVNQIAEVHNASIHFVRLEGDGFIVRIFFN
jgi:two-component system sensor histidine kinase TctE